MPQQTFSVTENAKVQIRACHNRVTVVGWDDAHTVATDSGARQDGNMVVVENAGKVTVRVPRAASVTISHCRADVRVDDLTGSVELEEIDGDVVLRNLRGETIVRDLDGSLAAKDIAALKGEGKWEGDVALRDVKEITVEEIEGDASLSDVETAMIQDLAGDLVAKQIKSLNGNGTWQGDAVLRSVESAEVEEIEGEAILSDVGRVTLQTLDGDLRAQGIRGALTAGEVKGDVNLRDVAGRVTMERIGGDLIASGVRDAINAEEVKGDAVVSFDSIAALALRAKGDVVINLPEGADAEVVLEAPRGDLVVRAGIKVIEENESYLHGTLGSGGVKIQAESTDGDLIVSRRGTQVCCESTEPVGVEYARLGAQIAAEVRQSVRQSRDDLERGHRIAAEVRQSIRESLADLKAPGRHAKRHWAFRLHRHGHRHDAESEPCEESLEEPPRGPAAGSPERKAILDAIARGEINVDDAIKKLTGED